MNNTCSKASNSITPAGLCNSAYIYSQTCLERLPKGCDNSGLSWRVVSHWDTKTIEQSLRGMKYWPLGREVSLGKFDCIYF